MGVPAIIGQVLDDPIAKGVEAARRHRDVVEQQSVEHDPHHGPEREDDAVQRCVERETGG